MIFNLDTSMLAGTSVAQRQAWLVQAQAAYADLMMGGKPVSVSYEGKSVAFAASDASRLSNWIDLLLMSLGRGQRRRAMKPFFR